jgi:protein-L-isoaspartate(D-aspartate) O-methyltransferase
VLAALFGEVVSIERVRGLHETARVNLRALRELRFAFGDGRLGAPSSAPSGCDRRGGCRARDPGRAAHPDAGAWSSAGAVERPGGQALHLVERLARDSWN